ncbi:MAG: ribosome biogenesis GTP-binding protein YihA/YsxC [Deltaproteobacteria bacterium]
MRTRFITSAAQRAQFPDLGSPEIAFVGRSNVGKSSLLNVLANAKIARTSRTPGRTQLVNFFEVATADQTVALADLPGYGYAKVPKHVVRTWAPLIETYLEARETIRATLLLIDVRREVQPDDVALFDYLSKVAKGEVWVVATKADKLPKAKRKPAYNAIGAAFGLPPRSVVGTSASSRDGVDALWDRILDVSKTD